MHTTKITLTKKTLLTAMALITTATLLVVGMLAMTTNAASQHAGVSSNAAAVPGGADFILTVKHADSAVEELEVDHSLEATLPEFSVYADEADPYGGDQAVFASEGVSVTYSATTKEWVINFGSAITNSIKNEPAGITFYLTFKTSTGTVLWGGTSPITPESTFKFNLTAGTGDSVQLDVQEEDTPAVIPGVPNTSTVN